jgi:hypothetical protein
MRHALAFCLLFLSAGLGLAELKITGPNKVEPNHLVRLSADGAAADAALIWDCDREDQIDVEEVNGRYLFAGPAGTYKIKLRSIRLDAGKTKVETARITVVIGEPVPPVPPTPPNPPVPPTPPAPPAPIPTAGFRVLIIYKESDVGKLTPGQMAAIYGKDTRDYLNSKCAVGPDSKTKEWRIYDAGVDVSGESEVWRGAMKLERKTLPWIVVSDGKAGFSGPLPDKIEDTKALLSKYGEGK